MHKPTEWLGRQSLHRPTYCYCNATTSKCSHFTSSNMFFLTKSQIRTIASFFCKMGLPNSYQKIWGFHHLIANRVASMGIDMADKIKNLSELRNKLPSSVLINVMVQLPRFDQKQDCKTLSFSQISRIVLISWHVNNGCWYLIVGLDEYFINKQQE